MAATGIRLTARRRFAQFLITNSPEVELDGVPVGEAKWGAGAPTFFETTPGSHQVAVSFRYMRKQVGRATIDVDVPPDREVTVLYRSPWIVTNKGSLRAG